MPSPIQPNNFNGSGISFLPSISPGSISLESFYPSSFNSIGDTEADMLIDLWNNGKRLAGHRYSVPNGFPNKNLMRLQSSGLVNINGSCVEFTPKASGVIKTMVLAEQNSFYQKRKKKPYSVILAESKRPVRKSNLTHTAQAKKPTQPTISSIYIDSRRFAQIDQNGSTDSFKEYTIRIYINGNKYEVWAYGGRINGNQTGWPKGSFDTIGEARREFSRLCSEREKTYDVAASLGTVRSRNIRRDGARPIDLRGENSQIPGVYNSDAVAGASHTPRVAPPTSRPAAPSHRPKTPNIVPTKHIEDRGLPEGYVVEGPARVGLDASGRPKTGYFVVDSKGKPITQSIADTAEQATIKARPMLDLLSEESRLPEGYTIIGPPRDATNRGVYIVRDPTGLPVGAETTAKASVEKALEWAKANPSIKGPSAKTKPVEQEDPEIVAQTKKASELSQQLPAGYKFERGLKNFDPKSWFIIDEKGSLVGGLIDGQHKFAAGKNPQEAFDVFNDLGKQQVKSLSSELMKMLSESYRDAKSKVRIKTAKEEEFIEPVLGLYYYDVNGFPKNVKHKRLFLKRASDFISQVSSSLSDYGFIATPHVEEGGIASPGWADCLYFLKDSDRGMRIIIAFNSDSSIDKLTPAITFRTVSKSGTEENGPMHIHPPIQGPDIMAKSMIDVYKAENPSVQTKYIPEQVRSLSEALWEKMEEL